MSAQRARMIDDMILAGLAEGTRKLYVQAVGRLARHCHRSPDLLSEEEVRSYLLGLRQRGVARGTFQTSHYGLRFFYQHTLGRAWELFGEKEDRLGTEGGGGAARKQEQHKLHGLDRQGDPLHRLHGTGFNALRAVR